MIRCNLAPILAERRLRISKVSTDTKISRTTLTALCNNYSQGIQFETLDTLCMYLQIAPEKLINFIPVSINNVCVNNLDFMDFINWTANVNLTISSFGKEENTTIILDGFNIQGGENDSIVYSASADLGDDTRNNILLKKTFSYFTPGFLSDVNSMIQNAVLEKMKKKIKIDKNFSLSIGWPYELVGSI